LADQWAHSLREAVAPYQKELDAFRAEATDMLGIGLKKD
jgi:hypothetical protein